MSEDDATHEVTADDVLPHYERDETDEETGRKEIIEEDAHIDDVLDAVDSLAENSTFHRRKLVEFGKRMSTLIYHGGLTPSAAKAKAIYDITDYSYSNQDLADMLGMSHRGSFSSLRTKGAVDTVQSMKLHYMTKLLSVPLNLVFSKAIAAEPPADYEVRYTLLEVVDPRLEDEEIPGYDRHGPDPQLAPQEPKYALVETNYSPGRGNWSDDDPEDRTFGPFCGLDVKWYMDDEEVLDNLYEGRSFQTEEHAEMWRDLLASYGFESDVDPREVISIDVLLDDEL